MKKLILTVAPGNVSQATTLEYGFLLSETAALPEYLVRLRAALFLTGANLQSARVIDAHDHTEWFASPDLVQKLNGRHWLSAFSGENQKPGDRLLG